MQAVKFKVMDEFRKSRYEFVEIDNFIEHLREDTDADSQLISKEFFSALKQWMEKLLKMDASHLDYYGDEVKELVER